MRNRPTRPQRRGAPTLELLEPRRLLTTTYGRLPLAFQANRGQAPAEVEYVARGPGYALELGPTSSTLRLSGSVVLQSSLVGASSRVASQGVAPLPGVVNYLVGPDARSWITGVPTFAKVVTPGVYPGIDLVNDGSRGTLEYDFVVAPGADPSVIGLEFRGQDAMTLDARGNLLLHTSQGIVTHDAPVIYQEVAGVRRPVEGHFVMRGTNTVGFAIAAYDRSLPLTIDPVLGYSTFLGGPYTLGFGITVDAGGRAFVVGQTASTEFPTVNPLPGTVPHRDDAFISEYNAEGTALVFSTYFGGTGYDAARGVAVDASGFIIIGGSTTSTDLPIKNALQPVKGPAGPTHLSIFGGEEDSFVAKLAPDGAGLVFSTYLGGAGDDTLSHLTLDSAGDIYLAGRTFAQDFPTVNPIQATNGGAADAFVAKMKSDGSALVYSTYLGGDLDDNAAAIAVDASGSAVIAGGSFSANFPTLNPIQATNHSAASGSNAIIARINPAGSSLVFSTYLGGSFTDGASGVALDDQGNIYAAGLTNSSDFPVVNAYQPVHAGGGDGFISKLDPLGTSLLYSTYLGGGGPGSGDNRNDGVSAVAVDALGQATVIGFTTSRNFPMVDPIQAHFGAGEVAVFLSRLGASGSTLLFSTYLTGSGSDGGLDVALDVAGNAYLTGYTSSPDFPTVHPVQPYIGSNLVSNAFVTKVIFTPALLPVVGLWAVPNVVVVGQTITLTATVSGAGSPPTGVVRFFDGDTLLGQTSLDATGTAVLRVASLGLGNHGILAVYSGDPVYVTGSAAVPITVTANPGTSLVAFPSTASPGQAVTLSLTMGVVDGVIPTGTVTFGDGASVFAVVPLDANGRATVVSPALSAGTNVFTATYSGDAAYPASAYSLAVESVAPATVEQAFREGFHRARTRLVLSFSQPLNPARASNRRAYRLLNARTGRRIRLVSAVYDVIAGTVTLRTARPVPLRVATMLTVRGTGAAAVLDTFGRAIDGDNNGTPGGDFARRFTRGDLQERKA